MSEFLDQEQFIQGAAIEYFESELSKINIVDLAKFTNIARHIYKSAYDEGWSGCEEMYDEDAIDEDEDWDDDELFDDEWIDEDEDDLDDE